MTGFPSLCWILFSLFLACDAGSEDGSGGQMDHGVKLETTRPLIIGHRGASGILPEHTLLAYRTAIGQGADVIECDVVVTQDLQPVCLHEPMLSAVTDIAARPEFAARRKTVNVGGSHGNVTDWFTVDFTLSELKTLKVKQRFDFRDGSQNGRHSIPTLAEYIAVAQNVTTRTIGIYPEVKVPEFLNSLDILNGTRVEDIVLESLRDAGYSAADDPCFIQTFSEDSALYLASMTSLPVVMLYDDDSWKSKLAYLSEHFYGIGVWKENVAQFYNEEKGYKNWINGTSSLIADAHEVGLKVHAYTFRNEDRYLAWDFKQDPTEEYKFFLDQGLDGFFTDFPGTLADYMDIRYQDDVTGMTCPANSATRVSVTIATIFLFCFAFGLAENNIITRFMRG